MAQVVGGFATPHNPFLPVQVPANPTSGDAQAFAVIRERLRAVAPDVIVAFSPDHLNTYFYDNLPALAIGVVDRFVGPNDGYDGIAQRSVRSNRDLAMSLYRHALRSGFDLARTENLEVDHSILVPLELLAPGEDVVVVPIIMNVLAPPILSSWRARDFGKAIADGVRAFPQELRVAFLADGGINQEVGGPRADEGALGGAPDRDWHEHIVSRLRAGEIDQLVAEATNERIELAGNAAGELLTVLAMAGAAADGPPEYVWSNPVVGHCFSAWNLSRAD